MQKIMPCLWFDGQAEEAAKFYVSVFKSGRILETSYWGKTGPGKEGAVLTVRFEMEGQEFLTLNGGPHYKFTPAVSMSVNCEDQREVDVLWDRLTSDGGQESRCGWLIDKYGLSWQIVPKVLPEMMKDKDPEKAKRVTLAMMQMKKIDIAALKRAYGQ